MISTEEKGIEANEFNIYIYSEERTLEGWEKGIQQRNRE